MTTLSEIKARIQRLEKAASPKGTDDCFDDYAVGPVEDDEGNPITDPVRLVTMGYSVV